MTTYEYNPIPPRVWSRVQNICTYDNTDVNINAVEQYNMKVLYKGNILQYKQNSAGFTKNQKYARIANGFSNNRNKVFATQTQTYSNPNIYSLLRSGYQTYPFPNNIPGAPNNPSGPFQPNVANPNGCSSNSVQDGGSLIAGIYANPCTNEIIKELFNSETICSPMSASDVPGSGVLCWNRSLQTYYPRYKYTNNNSGTKWPQGYKGFVSAVRGTSCFSSNV